MDKNTKTLRVGTFTVVFGFLVFGSCLCLCQPIDFARLELDLRSTITNRNVSDEVLLQSISRLGKVTEPPQFWTRIANDSTYSETHRRRCVFALFRRHGRTCSSVVPLGRKLAPANWLRDEDIELITHVFGGFPIDFTAEDSVFRIGVLPGRNNPAPNVYLRIQGKVSRDDFVKLLRRQTTDSGLRDALILERGFTDDYDTWMGP